MKRNNLWGQYGTHTSGISWFKRFLGQTSYCQPNRLISDPHAIVQLTQIGLSDHKGPESINLTIVKYGEIFNSHHRALTSAVGMLSRESALFPDSIGAWLQMTYALHLCLWAKTILGFAIALQEAFYEKSWTGPLLFSMDSSTLFKPFTCQPLYNTARYNTVLDITWF